MISTLSRLRDDKRRFWSTSSVRTSTPSYPIDLTFCASSLVLGWSTAKVSTTRMRSSRASCERIEAIPARYILRFTLCEKFSSGELGKILPPPRHSGLEVMPARARPVPFWRLGLGRLLPRRLGDLPRGTDDPVAAVRAGHRALHEQQLPLGVDAHHLEIGNRAARAAQMPGHALAREDAPGRLVLAGGARHPVRDRVAMGSVLPAEVIALDDASESLADGDTLYVDKRYHFGGQN